MKVATAKRALSTGRMTVSAQRGVPVAGIVLSTPRGEAASVVASPEELRAIASELESRADAAEPGTMDSLRDAIRTALGRDPFA